MNDQIKFIKNSDMFDYIKPGVALVNPVNCVGTMGKGLALEFKKRFPENYRLYVEHIEESGLIPGAVFPTYDPTKGVYILNVATKDHWKDPSRLEWIQSCVGRLGLMIILNNYDTMCIPALGCGLGGLPWSVVKKEIKSGLIECLQKHYIKTHFLIFEPKD